MRERRNNEGAGVFFVGVKRKKSGSDGKELLSNLIAGDRHCPRAALSSEALLIRSAEEKVRTCTITNHNYLY